MSTLRLDELAPRDRLLEVTVDGRLLRLPVRGTLTVPQMIQLLSLEQRMNEAAAAGGAQLADVFADAYAAVMSIVRERTSDAPGLELDIHQTMRILGWLAGADTVTAAVTDVLGATPADDSEDGPSVPLAGGRSETSSSTSSSPSAGSTAGGPSGGPAAAGAPSASTSATSSG